MENITLGEIAGVVGFIATLITSLAVIMKYLSNTLKKKVDETLSPIQESITGLDIAQCKNYLVRFLADIEQGNEVDPVEIERAYEIYDHYTNDLKQNSYIHKRWSELMEKTTNK